jgi:hypothetical protein
MKNNVIKLAKPSKINWIKEFNEICAKYDRQYFMYNDSLRIIGDGKIYSAFSIVRHNNQINCFTSDHTLDIDTKIIQKWLDENKIYLIEDLIQNIENKRVKVEVIIKNIK